MKKITVPEEYLQTISDFIEWFKNYYDLNDNDAETRSQLCTIKRLTEIAEGTYKPIIKDYEIKLLMDFLQTARRDESCTIERSKLENLYNYIKDNND